MVLRHTTMVVIYTTMDIITKQQAKEQGLLRYYTGSPCLRGHLSERHTKSGTCIQCGNQKSREWNVARGYSSAYYQDNKQEMVQYGKQWRQDNPNKMRAYSKTDGARLIATLNQMRRRATRKGIEFSLTKENLTIPEVCPILGIRLERSADIHSDNSPSFDRVDNTKGYTPDNVRVISWRANRLKADATLDEIEAIAAYIKAHNKKNNHATTTTIKETTTSTS